MNMGGPEWSRSRARARDGAQQVGHPINPFPPTTPSESHPGRPGRPQAVPDSWRVSPCASPCAQRSTIFLSTRRKIVIPGIVTALPLDGAVEYVGVREWVELSREG